MQPTGKPVESKGPMRADGPGNPYDERRARPGSSKWGLTVRAQIDGAVSDVAAGVAGGNAQRQVVAVYDGD